MDKVPITVAFGDGIGPEIMDATLRIIEAAGARIAPEVIEIGEKVYLRGIPEGIELSAFESIRRTRVFLKAPITTPQGGGYKSLNVTTRMAFGLYANVRPCKSYYPYVKTKHPELDVVIIRENQEDLYTGIEHQQTPDVVQCLKLITRPGTEKIVRYAFEYARANNRKKVTCFTKDNIMKMADGLFHRVFDEIGTEYPDIEKEHWIVDIGAAKLADTPEHFDVVVMPNLYGDILSDVAAQIAGSVGLAGSANIGEHCAMFEAIHGSAPRRAGQNLANPSGLLMGAVMMLVHIGQPDVAERVQNAWLKTIEDGVHTYDIFDPSISSQKVGTKEFADAVIARLGEIPTRLKPVTYGRAGAKAVVSPAGNEFEAEVKARNAPSQQLVGVDLFIRWSGGLPGDLAALVVPVAGEFFQLTHISNRGQRVWPSGYEGTTLVDHWRCRLVAKKKPLSPSEIIQLLKRVDDAGLHFIKLENLYEFDGKPGYASI
ncbi:MAG: NADP-dependent isocitrate dehydrogenase [Candidatus Sumerlaeaceae bacterium]|nr:NADP-dependent isocitrate dehydrogenase [Candidatus Sumerlaeaceae bacterium]